MKVNAKLVISNILKKDFSYNFIIYFFLIWNAIKLFLINSDPIIQVLNLLVSGGIYFYIEDQKLEIRNKKSFTFFLGLVALILTIIRSFILNSVADKYYYFNLSFGIFALVLILKSSNKLFYLRNIFLLSLLLPFRRVFFKLSINCLRPLTKYLTWFVLFIIGKDPIPYNTSLFVDDVEIRILSGCAGADNLYFVLSTLVIYMFIFRLRYKFNRIIIIIASLLVSIIINIFRNSVIALVVSSNKPYKDIVYNFLHDSYGSLIFSCISVTLISLIYFKLLNREVKY